MTYSEKHANPTEQRQQIVYLSPRYVALQTFQNLLNTDLYCFWDGVHALPQNHF